jgi:hypothetical protein
VMTFSVGNSAETLYLYLIGIAAAILGPTVLSVQVVSWIAALGCIWLTAKLAQRLDERIPLWVPLLVGASSVWLYHYARSGLRAIAAPVFLAAFALLLDRMERAREGLRLPLLSGVVLGLGIYAYTSARVIRIAFAVYAAARLAANRDRRGELLRRYGAVVAGAAVISIPNLVFLLQHPRDFLFRGSYVLGGSVADRVLNTIWCLLLPLHYPAHYRQIGGPAFLFDGISAHVALVVSEPFNILFAAAMLLGIWETRRRWKEPAPAFLGICWAVAILALGPSGPSLTRMLLLWPVYVVFSAAGLAAVIERWPRLRPVLPLCILAAATVDGVNYFRESARFAEAFGSAATPIAEYADGQAAQGRRVLCVISKSANTVNFLTHRHNDRVKIVEFYQRPLVEAELPVREFRPDLIVVERSPVFRAYTAGFPPLSRVAETDDFVAVKAAGQ